MKNLIQVLTIFLITGFGSLVQAQKMAHIDSEKLLSLMPEKAVIEKTLMAEADKHKVAIEKMQKDLQVIYVKYEAEQAKVSNEVNQTRSKELQDKQKKMGDYQQMAAKEVAKKEEELFRPVLQKAQNAINEVAKLKGFDYVFLSSALVVANGYDLLADVKTKLGIL